MATRTEFPETTARFSPPLQRSSVAHRILLISVYQRTSVSLGCVFRAEQAGENSLGFGLPVTTVMERQLVQLVGIFNDHDLDESHTITISWADGDQTTLHLPASDPPKRIFAALHEYRDDIASHSGIQRFRRNKGSHFSARIFFKKDVPWCSISRKPASSGGGL